MTKNEQALRKRFVRVVSRHRRGRTAETWFALGKILAEAHDISRALGTELAEGFGDPITCWRHCVRLDPKHADAWHQLGQAYFELDERTKAVRALTRAVKLDPHVPSAWNTLGILALPPPEDFAPARVKRAEQFLRRAIEEDRRGKKLGWEPFAWLAEAAERRRHDPDALAWYAEANKRGDRYAEARRHVIEGHGARRRGAPRRSH